MNLLRTGIKKLQNSNKNNKNKINIINMILITIIYQH